MDCKSIIVYLFEMYVLCDIYMDEYKLFFEKVEL